MNKGLAFTCCAMLIWAASAQPAGAESIGVPSWTYEAMGELASNGYVRFPDGKIHGLTRQQMAEYTAKVLKQLDDDNYSDKNVKLSQTYAVVTRMSIQDELQHKLLQERLRQLESDYNKTLTAIKVNAEKSARMSMRGSNDLVGLKVLKDEERSNEAKLAGVIGQLASAKAKLAQYPIVQEQWQTKKADVEQQLALSSSENTMTPARTAQIEMAMKLRAEFAPELSAMGYFDDETAQREAELPPTVTKVLAPGESDKRLKIDGEIRLDTRHNSNEAYTPVDLSRVRERLYMDYNIDDNWHLVGMLESEKAIQGEGNDGRLRLDRYYVTGNVGIAHITAGAYNAFMAEGNIYDSKFKGVMAEAGAPVKYRIQTGSIDDADKVYTAEASYDTPDYGLDGGIYHFEMKNSGEQRNIIMANVRKPIGSFDLGLMYLHGADKAVGDGHGFVGTLSHGKADTWKPGSSSFYIKYYHQPASTYVLHTMNGMADMMQGFKGWGIGYSRTLRKNIVASLEYDRLSDLATGERNNTIWAGLSYFFNNYETS